MSLPSVGNRTLGKPLDAVWATFVCRVSNGHLAKALPSARKKTLGKACFAIIFFAISALPSVALGKWFAECFLLFALS